MECKTEYFIYSANITSIICQALSLIQDRGAHGPYISSEREYIVIKTKENKARLSDNDKALQGINVSQFDRQS